MKTRYLLIYLLLITPLAWAGDRPVILAGGYFDSDITTIGGGYLSILAAVYDPQGNEDIHSVELYFDLQPTGILLKDDGQSGDFSSGDGIFGFVANVPSGIPEGLYLFQIVAIDKESNISNIYPYLTIDQFSAKTGIYYSLISPVYDWTYHFKEVVGGKEDKVIADAPRINLAGYLFTEISNEQGGILYIVAWAVDRNDDLKEVQLYFQLNPTGIYLVDDGTMGDLQANDHIYSLRIPFEPGAPAGQYLLEMVAKDKEGNLSPVWPYLNILSGITPTATPTATPTPTLIPCQGDLDCSSALILNCGDKIRSNNIGKPSVVERYNCSYKSYAGPETVYKFLAGKGNITIHLTEWYPKDINLLLLRQCCERDCVCEGLTISTDLRRATWYNPGEAWFYLVADGINPSDQGEFSLELDCSTPSVPTATPTPFYATPTPTPTGARLDCSNPIYLSCGDMFQGNTSAGTNNVQKYGICAPTLYMNGPEVVHEFNLREKATIRIRLTNTTADLEAFLLLGICNEVACYTSSDREIIYPNAVPGKYYLVIDGVDPNPGAYTITINCDTPSSE